MVRGERNNNPGNIRAGKAKWRGAVGTDDKGFVIFERPHFGIRAIAKVLLTYSSQGVCTPSAIIGRYAPEIENNTSAYIKEVCKQLGVGASTVLAMRDSKTLSALVRAVISVECGRVAYDEKTIGEAIESAINGGSNA